MSDKAVCYILVNKGDDLYNTIDPTHFEIRYVFDYITPGTGLNAVKAVLESVLDKADPVRDRIVFNGPAWLIALAGWVWYTQDERTHYGMLTYDTKQNRYHERSEEIK
jgi:hypothetical protein